MGLIKNTTPYRSCKDSTQLNDYMKGFSIKRYCVKCLLMIIMTSGQSSLQIAFSYSKPSLIGLVEFNPSLLGFSTKCTVYYSYVGVFPSH